MVRGTRMVMTATLLAAVGAVAWMVLRQDSGETDGGSRGGTSPAPSVESGTGAAVASASTAGEAIAAEPFAGPTPTAGSGTGPSEGNSGGTPVTGRVVDDRRRPVAGAEVKLFRHGRPPVAGSTDVRGRFRIPFGPVRPGRSEGAAIRVRRGEAGGSGSCTHRGDLEGAIDAGTIVLGPTGSLEIAVREVGAAAADVPVLVASGGVVVAGARTGDDGVARFHGMTAAYYEIQAARTPRRRATAIARMSLPSAGPTRIDLELRDGREILVTVVEAGTEAPIPGARVQAWVERHFEVAPREIPIAEPFAPPPTDAAGRTRVTGAEEGLRVRVSADAEDFAPPEHVAWVPPARSEARVRLARELVLAWPIVDGEVPAPPQGSVIELVPDYFTTLRQGLVTGGRLVVAGARYEMFGAWALAPDGSIARLQSPPRNPISFRRARAVDVVVTDTRGGPLEGCEIGVASGFTPLAPVARTDAAGHARVGGLFGGIVDVQAGFGGPRRPVGTVDLDQGDGRLAVTLEPAMPAVIRVSVDGERRLPARYSLRLNGGLHGAIEEDAERGDLTFSLIPTDAESPVRATLSSPEHPDAEADLVLQEAGYACEASIDLRSGSTLILHVRPPPMGGQSIEIESWCSKTGIWKTMERQPTVRSADPGDAHVLVLAGLPPSRYRARDLGRRIVSEPVEVAGNGGTYEISFDLSAVFRVSGRVEFPPGTSSHEVFVLVEGDGIERRELAWRRGFAPDVEGLRVGAQGEFTAWGLAGRTIRLRPWHPVYSPAADRGEITVDRAQDDVVLRLERRTEAVLRLSEGSTRAMNNFPSTWPAVLLYRGRPEGPPAVRLLASGEIRFGGFEPGTWTIWIDVPQRAPLVLRDVLLGEGVTDLGSAKPERGSILKLRFPAPSAGRGPSMSITAESMDEPRYVRRLTTTGEAEGVLSGLGPGRFKVSVVPTLEAGALPRERIIDADGRSEVVLDVKDL